MLQLAILDAQLVIDVFGEWTHGCPYRHKPMTSGQRQPAPADFMTSFRRICARMCDVAIALALVFAL